MQLFRCCSAEDSLNDALDCRLGNASRWDGGLQALECCMECFALGPVFSPGGAKGMYRWVERQVTSVSVMEVMAESSSGEVNVVSK
jgi:hypothetical protein